MQVSLVSRARQSRGVPWTAATKIGVPDTCNSSLAGDTGALEYGKGRVQGRRPPVSVPGVCPSGLLDLCVLNKMPSPRLMI